jgi:hypothetical protein
MAVSLLSPPALFDGVGVRLTVVENKDLHCEAKISSRHASILKQYAIALELFN